ncbi:unnamed protein product [Camellia sinensis]
MSSLLLSLSLSLSPSCSISPPTIERVPLTTLPSNGADFLSLAQSITSSTDREPHYGRCHLSSLCYFSYFVGEYHRKSGVDHRKSGGIQDNIPVKRMSKP